MADAQISCIPEEGVDIHQSNIMKAATGACDINDPARALSLHDGPPGLNQADLASVTQLLGHRHSLGAELASS